MHDIRLQKYHYQSGYGSSLLVRNFDQGGGLLGSPVESSLTESSLAPFFQIHRFPFGDIRRFTNLNSYFGAVTIVAFIFAAIMVLCSIAVSSACRDIQLCIVLSLSLSLSLSSFPLSLSLGVGRKPVTRRVTRYLSYSLSVRSDVKLTGRASDGETISRPCGSEKFVWLIN